MKTQVLPATGSFLSRAAASAYLGKNNAIRASVPTLDKYACLGGGPKYRKVGRYPVYALEDLDAWARERTSPLVSSTSEYSMSADTLR